MARDYITLGSAPAEEECVSVTSDGDYKVAMQKETERYVRQLKKMFVMTNQRQCRFDIKWFDNDSGPYCEAIVWYNPDDELSSDYAHDIDEGLPDTWE